MSPKDRIARAVGLLDYYTRTKAYAAVAAQAGAPNWRATPEAHEACVEWARDLDGLKAGERRAYIERRHSEVMREGQSA